MDLFVQIIIWVFKLLVLIITGFAILFPYDFLRIFRGEMRKKPFFLYLIFIRFVALILFVAALIFFFMG